MTVPYDHPAIDAWIAEHGASVDATHPLFARSPVSTNAVIEKLGVLPVVVEEGKLHVLLTEPPAKFADGRPGFQLPKGTRRYWNANANQWDDIGRAGHEATQMTADTVLESPLQAALRESMEEVGTRLSNIRRVIDLGVVEVHSAKAASEGKAATKLVHLFAAEMKNKADFDPPESNAATRVKWWPISASVKEPENTADADFIRPDHLSVLRLLPAHLGPLLGQGHAFARTK